MFQQQDGRRVAVKLDPIPLHAGLYDLGTDPGEHENRIASERHAARAARLTAALRAHVAATAPGIHLSCTSSDGTPLEGTIRFDQPPVDEPFALPGSRARATTTSRGSWAFWIPPEDPPGGLVFQPGAELQRVQLEMVAADGAGPQRGVWHREAMADGAVLGPCSLRLRAAPAAAPAGPVEINAEDRARLEALGYLE